MTFVHLETSPSERIRSVADALVPLWEDEPPPRHTATIVEKCTQKLVDEYNHMLTQATESPSTFLRYITYMIDNVVLVVAVVLHGRDELALLEKRHPLGLFDRYVSGHKLLI